MLHCRTERSSVVDDNIGTEGRKTIIDKAIGKNYDRKDFKDMMAFARAGDTVIVESILERQHEGIEIAKAEGEYKRRKPIWTLVSPPKTTLRHI